MSAQTTDNKETRFIGNIESRANDDNKMTIGGVAARFETYTTMGWYAEVIKRGFFDGIDTSQTAALKNHDSSLILGRTSNNTLSLNVTNEGLEYEVQLPQTQTGRDTFEEVKRGDIHQSSFQFTVKEEIWRSVDRSELAGVLPDSELDRLSYGGKIEIRELVKGGKLYDVSPVTFPAYLDTNVAKRSYESVKERKIEKVDISTYELRIKAAEAAANYFKF